MFGRLDLSVLSICLLLPLCLDARHGLCCYCKTSDDFLSEQRKLLTDIAVGCWCVTQDLDGISFHSYEFFVPQRLHIIWHSFFFDFITIIIIAKENGISQKNSPITDNIIEYPCTQTNDGCAFSDHVKIKKLNQRVEEEEKNTRIIYHTLFFLYPWGLINSISWMHYLRSLFKKAKRIRWNYLTYSHAMHSAPWSDKRKLCSLAHIQKTPCT